MINWTENGYGKCSDEYYTLLSVLSDDFPVPECSKVRFLQIENFDTVTHGAASYEVDRYWTEEFESYETYAMENNYTIVRSDGLATYGELEFTKGDDSVVVTSTKMGMDKTEVYVNSSIMIDE